MLAGRVLCGLAEAWMLDTPLVMQVAWLLLWSVTVAGDSPQFSALTAQLAPRVMVDSLLTFVNAICLCISVRTITLFAALADSLPLAQGQPC